MFTLIGYSIIAFVAFDICWIYSLADLSSPARLLLVIVFIVCTALDILLLGFMLHKKAK